MRKHSLRAELPLAHLAFESQREIRMLRFEKNEVNCAYVYLRIKVFTTRSSH